MIKSLKSLAESANLEYIGKDISIDNVSINSNEIINETLFVAIVANRDGHDFIPLAIKNGAKAILVSKRQDVEIPQIVCKNTIRGLRSLARVKRELLNSKVISMTGTCGKTSVKEMLVCLLSDYKVHFTKGNLNNYIGVPITLLEAPIDSDFVVIEAGTSVKGEIANSANIIQPDVATITNVGASHLENLKSLDGVMTEKGDLLLSLDKTGTAVINIDDERIKVFSEKLKCKKISISCQDNADIYLKKYVKLDSGYKVTIDVFDKEYSYILSVDGYHNVFNSLCAIAMLISAGLKIEEFISYTKNFEPYSGRYCAIKVNNHITLINDTYNSSAPSVKSAINDLSNYNGVRILVASSMKELGDSALFYHRQMAKWINLANIDKVYLYGEKSYLDVLTNEVVKKESIKQYIDKKILIKDLISYVDNKKNKDIQILVKGARSYKMEEIVKAIVDEF